MWWRNLSSSCHVNPCQFSYGRKSGKMPHAFLFFHIHISALSLTSYVLLQMNILESHCLHSSTLPLLSDHHVWPKIIKYFFNDKFGLKKKNTWFFCAKTRVIFYWLVKSHTQEMSRNYIFMTINLPAYKFYCTFVVPEFKNAVAKTIRYSFQISLFHPDPHPICLSSWH